MKKRVKRVGRPRSVVRVKLDRALARIVELELLLEKSVPDSGRVGELESAMERIKELWLSPMCCAVELLLAKSKSDPVIVCRQYGADGDVLSVVPPEPMLVGFDKVEPVDVPELDGSDNLGEGRWV